MSIRDHLRRLPRNYYIGDAIIHWTITIRDRKTGWLDAVFLYQFREVLTHTMFRYGLACPIFCLMPDHIHMVWMGLFPKSDQLNAMKHFRPRCDRRLKKARVELQDQAYDHVFKDEERIETEFHDTCNYIARNPERAGLVKLDAYDEYPFSGCLVPGYPELEPFVSGYWDQFDRIVSRLRRVGLQQIEAPE